MRYSQRLIHMLMNTTIDFGEFVNWLENTRSGYWPPYRQIWIAIMMLDKK